MPWRGLVLILAALVFFGATVRGLGLAPALFVTAFAQRARQPQQHPGSPPPAAGGGADASSACSIFSYGLGVPVPLLGPWLRF